MTLRINVEEIENAYIITNSSKMIETSISVMKHEDHAMSMVAEEVIRLLRKARDSASHWDTEAPAPIG